MASDPGMNWTAGVDDARQGDVASSPTVATDQPMQTTGVNSRQRSAEEKSLGLEAVQRREPSQGKAHEEHAHNQSLPNLDAPLPEVIQPTSPSHTDTAAFTCDTSGQPQPPNPGAAGPGVASSSYEDADSSDLSRNGRSSAVAPVAASISSGAAATSGSPSASTAPAPLLGATTTLSGAAGGAGRGDGGAAVSGRGGGSGSRAGGGGGVGGGGSSKALSAKEPGSSLLEQVSREVIRKLRLAASADRAEDRHVICEELFADITCALDASALAALVCPEATRASAASATMTLTSLPPALFVGGVGGGGGLDGDERTSTAAADVAAAGTVGRRRSRGRLYYEVLAVHYATRAAADSARALLHLCQLLWDTPWVAPIYALLLHRFLLLPRDVGSAGAGSPTAAAAAAAAAAGSATAASALNTGGGASAGEGRAAVAAAASVASSYADSRVKHLNVLAHGTRQLLLGDVHSGLARFEPLWSFLALEVAGLAAAPPPPPLAAAGPASALPPVASIDAVPATARPWLLAVAAAFLPYYCLDEQFPELARRFPPPLPLPTEAAASGSGGGGFASWQQHSRRHHHHHHHHHHEDLKILGSGSVWGLGPSAAAAAALAGLDFLIVEVTDVLGRINSEAGLLKYLGALRALARPPPPPEAPEPQAPAATPTRVSSGGGAGVPGRVKEGSGSSKPARAGSRTSPQVALSAPLAGLPTITKLRLQSELYSLTSGGGPRYAPPEVRKAAFATLDALFPGGRSLRWLVRWASRTLHLEWLESDGDLDDPWVGRGWLGWAYWPIHWCTALYGRLLLTLFQLLYGIVVWRPGRGGGGSGSGGGVGGGGGGVGAAAEVGGLTGAGGAITSRSGAAMTTGAAGVASAAGGGVATAGATPVERGPVGVGWWRHERTAQAAGVR